MCIFSLLYPLSIHSFHSFTRSKRFISSLSATIDSSTTSLISSNQQILSKHNETYRYFDGIQDIIVESKGDNRIYFTPLVLQNTKQEDLWNWSKNKKIKHMQFKTAVATPSENIKPHFDALSSYIVADKCDILQVNADFFYSMNDKNMDMMASLWSDMQNTLCIRGNNKSGKNYIYNGAIKIMKYWNSYFQTKSGLKVSVKDIQLFYYGEMAVVTCKMNEEYRVNGRKYLLKCTVSNIFERHVKSKRYVLVSHVCSLIPNEDTPSDMLKETYMNPSTVEANKMGGKRSRPTVISMSGRLPSGMQQIYGGIVGGDDGEDDDDDDGDVDMEENDDSDGTDADDGKYCLTL